MKPQKDTYIHTQSNLHYTTDSTTPCCYNQYGVSSDCKRVTHTLTHSLTHTHTHTHTHTPHTHTHTHTTDTHTHKHTNKALNYTSHTYINTHLTNCLYDIVYILNTKRKNNKK